METTANNAMRTLKVKSVVTRRGFFVFTNCWHSRRGSRETEGESIGGQHFTQREREREKEKEKERKRSRRIDAQRRESTKSTSPRPFEMVPSRKNEKTARSSRPSLWGNRISQRERERESPRNVRPRPRTLTVLYVNRSSFRSFKMLPKPMLSRRPKHPLFARKAHESNWCPSKGAL